MAIILKIDKPKSCADCILTYAKVCPLTNNSVVKDIINDTLSKDCPLKSADDYKSVMDKIKAEIKQYQSDYDVHGTEYDRTAWKAFNRCLQIIDKYKVEIEPQESENKE